MTYNVVVMNHFDYGKFKQILYLKSHLYVHRVKSLFEVAVRDYIRLQHLEQIYINPFTHNCSFVCFLPHFHLLLQVNCQVTMLVELMYPCQLASMKPCSCGCLVEQLALLLILPLSAFLVLCIQTLRLVLMLY